ncbi:MAG: alanine--glyoxylate aminotransferase family protein [Acidimicrobiia bacterium]|nr:alanine--glyoxylate aminotransferase family protein [Acidimicrobiia bacterium]
MATLPTSDRLLLGPGPSPVSARVMQALAAPARSHLDPDVLDLLDDVRGMLGRVFQAPDGNLSIAVSGTGTAAMDAAAMNLIEPGMTVLAIVTGYFGERLAQVFARSGAYVERLHVEWGRSVDPALVERALIDARFDVVAMVHGETSTGVRNPVEAIAPIVRRREALFVVDAVTSLGTIPVDVSAWDADIVYACGQKGLGAPPGLSPITVSPRARHASPTCHSYACDFDLLEAFWVRRQYHHTISSPLVYALHTALTELFEEGLEARWARHQAAHDALVAGLAGVGLELFADPPHRLISLNAVRIPPGLDEKAVRARLLTTHGIEIGAGLGPLAGRIWRIGLMGSGATLANVDRVVSALAEALGRKRPK